MDDLIDRETSVRSIIVPIAAAAAIALTAPAATAQPAEPTPEQLELARQAYARGAEAFAKKDFDTAIEAFKESYRRSRNPLLLYNIGVTLEELGDKKLALFYYRKFLTDAPPDVKNRAEAARRASALAAALEGKTPAPPKPDTEEKPSAPKSNIGGGAQQFQHNVVGEAPPGKPLDITAFAPQDVGLTVYMYYRGAGASDFTKVQMKPRYQELVGRIPASVVSGSSLQYYVEARDVGDEIVHRSGKPTSPHIVLIDAAAKPRYYPDFGDQSTFDPGEAAGGQSRDDGPSDSMTYARWGATGGAVGFLALSATFLFIASDASSAIEGEAFESSEQDNCAEGRPCRTYESQRDLEARGKRFELLGNVTLALSIGAAATAGVLWYLHSKEKKKATTTFTAAPAVGRDFVGAAAGVRF